MKHAKQTRALALLLSLLLTATLFTACANGAGDVTPTPTNAVSETPTPAADTPTPAAEDQPESVADVLALYDTQDYGNTEFHIAASSSFENIFVIQQFTTDTDMTGDLVHDALYDRDRTVEEFYHIRLSYEDILDSRMASGISNGISAGDDEYGLILGTLAHTALPFLQNDYLLNYNDYEDIHLSRPWWNKNSIDNFQINGKIYMATGAITNRYVYAPNIMVFNLQLISDYELESPYKMVLDGTWTFDNFLSMLEDRYVDANGNDTADMADTFGLAPGSDSETAYFFGCGCHFAVRDGDSVSLTLGTDKNFEVLDKISDMFDAEYSYNTYNNSYDLINVFSDGQALFCALALCDITMLKDMADPYGFVPMPKYDETQTEYYTTANRFISTMALFPVSLRDPHKSAQVAELLAAVSQFTSLDKQYETVLLNRQTYDNESKQILRLIVEAISYDWVYVYDFNQLRNDVTLAINAGKHEYSSLFAEKETAVQEELNELLAKFE